MSVAKLPRIDTSPEILRYLQRIAQGASGDVGSVQKGFIAPDANLRDNAVSTTPGAWPAANRAIYVPFSISAEVTVTSMGTTIAGTGGNIDYGIYSEDGAALYRNGGHAASANTFDSSAVNITLAPDFYYLAVACDAALITMARVTSTIMGNVADAFTAIGVKQQASAYPLPANATFDTPASAYMPLVILALSRDA